MSAPTAVDEGALLRGLARRSVLVLPRSGGDEWAAPAWDGPERRRADALGALGREHDRLCIEACDTWEIAAGLESAGIDDRRARVEFGVGSVFDLAAELYALVPRRPAESSAPDDPWALPLRHHLLRGLVTALPAVAYLAGLHVLGPKASLARALLPLLVAGVVSAGASQAFSVLDHALLGRLERAAAFRLCRIVLGSALAIAVLWSVLAPLVGVDRGVAITGGAQLVYALAATGLLVTGRDRLLLGLLVPVALAGVALLVVPAPWLARLGPAGVPGLLATTGVLLAGAVAAAVLAHRPRGAPSASRRPLEVLSPGEVGLALECGGYGLAVCLFGSFPLLDVLAGRPAPLFLPVALLPLLTTAGVADRLVHGLRGAALEILDSTTRTSGFAHAARTALRKAVAVQAAVAALTGAVAGVVVAELSPGAVGFRLVLTTAAAAVLAVVLVVAALMVSLGQHRAAGVVVATGVAVDAASRAVLTAAPGLWLDAAHVAVAVAVLVAALRLAGARYTSPSAHR